MAQVKICGLSTPESVEAAVGQGARYVGFVFYPPSPRSLEPEAAAQLAALVPPGVAKVGLFVDPDDELLDLVLAKVPLDMIQIHKVHDAARLAALRRRAGLPLIVAAPVATAEDVDSALALGAVGDIMLLDAKPAADASLPGGNGVSFDWRLLAGRRIAGPWMLAGGLNPQNVGAAINLTGAPIVDVSSGVESAPGIKDAALMSAFLRNAGVSGGG